MTGLLRRIYFLTKGEPPFNTHGGEPSRLRTSRSIQTVTAMTTD